MRKCFTLMEIMIASVIVVVLATLGMGGYLFLLEQAKFKKDVIQQQTVSKAAYIKSKETGSLGKLDLDQNLEYIGKAYAQIMEKANWFTKFSCFFVKINTPKQAYAAIEDMVDPNVMKKYGVDPQMLYCPSTGYRYGVNSNLNPNWRWEDIPAGTILFGDCETSTFNSASDLLPAHFVNPITKQGNAIATTIEGKTFAFEKEEEKTPISIRDTSVKLKFSTDDTLKPTGAALNITGIEIIRCRNAKCAKDRGYEWKKGAWRKIYKK